jgi:hypothetical protein
MPEGTISLNLGSRRTVTIILDIVTANNLLLALTNALQGGTAKKGKKKGGKAMKGHGLKAYKAA